MIPIKFYSAEEDFGDRLLPKAHSNQRQATPQTQRRQLKSAKHVLDLGRPWIPVIQMKQVAAKRGNKMRATFHGKQHSSKTNGSQSKDRRGGLIEAKTGYDQPLVEYNTSSQVAIINLMELPQRIAESYTCLKSSKGRRDDSRRFSQFEDFTLNESTAPKGHKRGDSQVSVQSSSKCQQPKILPKRNIVHVKNLPSDAQRALTEQKNRGDKSAERFNHFPVGQEQIVRKMQAHQRASIGEGDLSVDQEFQLKLQKMKDRQQRLKYHSISRTMSKFVHDQSFDTGNIMVDGGDGVKYSYQTPSHHSNDQLRRMQSTKLRQKRFMELMNRCVQERPEQHDQEIGTHLREIPLGVMDDSLSIQQHQITTDADSLESYETPEKISHFNNMGRNLMNEIEPEDELFKVSVEMCRRNDQSFKVVQYSTGCYNDSNKPLSKQKTFESDVKFTPITIKEQGGSPIKRWLKYSKMQNV